jgi:hypothetical protein
LKGRPRPGGMQAGGAVPPPMAPPPNQPKPPTVAPGQSLPTPPTGSGMMPPTAAPGTPAGAAAVDAQRQALNATAAQQQAGMVPGHPPSSPAVTRPPSSARTIAAANSLRTNPPAPQLPGGGRLTPPISGPNPDAGRMQPRRPDAMFKSIRDSLGGPPRPRRGRS